MMKKLAFYIFLFPLMFSLSLQLVSPIMKTIKENETVFIGKIGNGQTIAVEIYPKVFEGGKLGRGGNYDYAFALPPEGWKTKGSKIYGNPLQVTLTPHNVPPGNYTSKIVVVDEGNGEGLGNFTFYVVVEVIDDILDLNVSPRKQVVGLNQPAVFRITVKNNGDVGDVFIISAKNIPGWEFTKTVFVPPRQSKTIEYAVSYGGEGFVVGYIECKSLSSSIAEREIISLEVRSDPLMDIKALLNGLPLFSPFEGIVYSFFYLFQPFIQI